MLGYQFKRSKQETAISETGFCGAEVLSHSCLHRVISRLIVITYVRPLYPSKQTKRRHVGMSALCQQATFALQQLQFIRSPRRRRQAAQVARSGRAHARRLVVKLAAETPEMGKFPVNFPVSREFGAETGSHPTGVLRHSPYVSPLFISGVLDSRSQIHGPGRNDGRRRTLVGCL